MTASLPHPEVVLVDKELRDVAHGDEETPVDGPDALGQLQTEDEAVVTEVGLRENASRERED